MRAEEISQHLGEWEDEPQEPHRLELLHSISAIYESERVLVDGQAPALFRACPSCTACWRRDLHRIGEGGEVFPGPEVGENGSIYWPWIGADYEPGGLCVVAYNLVHEWQWWAPLTEEYAISSRQREFLSKGRKTADNGSKFWWHSMCSAAAVLASMAGAPPAEEYPPEAVAPLLTMLARVQTVKCSPLGERSRPSPEMVRFCPSRFLSRELVVLRPGVLLCLGNKAWSAVDEALGIKPTSVASNFRRGVLTLGEVPVEVLRVPHPGGAWGRWPTGQRELVRDLTASPLS